MSKSPARIEFDRVIPLREASYLTNLCEKTLRNCCARDELKIVKLSPRRVGVRLSELQRFIDKRAG